MSIVDVVVKAHKSGEIDLYETPGSDIARQFDCAASTISLAKKKLGISRKTMWRKLLEAHKNGEVDLTNWSFKKVMEKFGCSQHTVKRAIEEGKIDHIYLRGPVSDDPLKRSDDSTTRAYWWKYRKNFGVFKAWGVIPERVGLTKNQWLRRNESNN